MDVELRISIPKVGRIKLRDHATLPDRDLRGLVAANLPRIFPRWMVEALEERERAEIRRMLESGENP